MHIYILLLSLIAIEKSYGVLTHLNDIEHYRLPRLFALDDFDKCLAHDGTYCVARFDLHGERHNHLLNIIHEYSAVTTRHYNYTYIERGICLHETCKRYLGNKNVSEAAVLNEVLEVCQNETVWNQHGLQTKLSEVYYCNNKVNTQIKTDFWDWLVAGVFIFILVVNIVGSIYDVFLHKINTKVKKVQGNGYLLSFSIFRNWKWLTSDEESENKLIRNFTYFNGAKILGLCVVIWGHVNYYLYGGFVSNPHEFEKKYDSYTFYIVNNGLMMVQVFFVMAGMLLVHKMLVHVETRRVTWRDLPQLLLYRWWRLTPASAVVLAFTSTWLRHISSGPLWGLAVTHTAAQDCRRYWWTHILYINNYVSDNKFCSIQTWHIAADAQVFLVSAAACIMMMSRPRARSTIMALLLLLSLLAPVFHVLIWDMEPLVIMDPQSYRHLVRDNTELHYMHQYGHNNMSGYVIGMMFGYLIYSWQRKGVDITKYKFLSFLCWLGIPAMQGVMVAAKVFYVESDRTLLLVRMAFAALHRPLVGLITAYMIIICEFNPNTTFSRMFSWRGWTVLSRLSYCVFLVHLNILHVVVGLRRHLMHATFFNTVVHYFGIMIMSYALALPLQLMVEGPMNYLLKVYRNKSCETPGQREKAE